MRRLKFETNEGDRFELDVSRNDTLEEIKRKIQIHHDFPISSQTLSFNGNIIATDTHLLAAPLTDGSQIHLHIAAEPPTEPNSRGSATEERAAASSSQSQPPPDHQIFVKFILGGFPIAIPVPVNPAQNARQLRSLLENITGFKTPDAFMFFHKNKRVKENLTFEAQKIRDGATIEILRGSFTGTEFRDQMIESFRQIGSSSSSAAPAPPSGEEDDVKFRVTVEHGYQRITSPYAADVRVSIMSCRRSRA